MGKKREAAPASGDIYVSCGDKFSCRCRRCFFHISSLGSALPSVFAPLPLQPAREGLAGVDKARRERGAIRAIARDEQPEPTDAKGEFALLLLSLLHVPLFLALWQFVTFECFPQR